LASLCQSKFSIETTKLNSSYYKLPLTIFAISIGNSACKGVQLFKKFVQPLDDIYNNNYIPFINNEPYITSATYSGLLNTLKKQNNHAIAILNSNSYLLSRIFTNDDLLNLILKGFFNERVIIVNTKKYNFDPFITISIIEDTKSIESFYLTTKLWNSNILNNAITFFMYSFDNSNSEMCCNSNEAIHYYNKKNRTIDILQ